MRKLIRDSDRCAEQMPFIKPKAGARLISKDRFSEIVFILPKENNMLKKTFDSSHCLINCSIFSNFIPSV